MSRFYRLWLFRFPHSFRDDEDGNVQYEDNARFWLELVLGSLKHGISEVILHGVMVW
jgi:hypothetical protein